jgi:hypothetical protein
MENPDNQKQVELPVLRTFLNPCYKKNKYHNFLYFSYFKSGNQVILIKSACFEPVKLTTCALFKQPL